MSPSPSLKRIAQALGVSESTVSRILSGQAERYRISAKTAERVMKHAAREKFVPNSLARSLRLKRTHTIGLVIPDITNPFFAGVARQIASAARRNGYTLILCDSEETPELEEQALRLLHGRNVEGIVLCPVGLTSEHLHDFVNSSVPVVQTDRFFTKLPWPYVGCENQAGARAATEHLLERGHTRVACLQGLPGSSTNDLRVAGYREAFAKARRQPPTGMVVGNSFSEEGGYAAAKQLLAGKVRPDAILALGNLIALGALRAIAEAGLTIPQDMAVISFDDQPYAEWLAAPMTTVVQPVSDMGELAATELFEAIRNPAYRKSRRSHLLPTRLVIRQSTAGAPRH